MFFASVVSPIPSDVLSAMLSISAMIIKLAFMVHMFVRVLGVTAEQVIKHSHEMMAEL